ncbi:hypothetical protein [Paraclostridium bifermentans]|uniref:hypothetical protein n=1 Tax=Paraclostridium bifermentans TaxID=1490 RepID=UPI00359C35DF
MKKSSLSKSIVLALIGFTISTPTFSTVSALEARSKEPVVEEIVKKQDVPKLEYSCSTEDWRVASKSIRTISKKYNGTVTKTTTTAYNAGISIKFLNLGSSKTYSETKKFKTYRLKREVKVKFKVYDRMGHFLRYENIKKIATTTYYEPI